MGCTLFCVDAPEVINLVALAMKNDLHYMGFLIGTQAGSIVAAHLKASGSIRCGTVAVSYTHLDVYKRQPEKKR